MTTTLGNTSFCVRKSIIDEYDLARYDKKMMIKYTYIIHKYIYTYIYFIYIYIFLVCEPLIFLKKSEYYYWHFLKKIIKRFRSNFFWEKKIEKQKIDTYFVRIEISIDQWNLIEARMAVTNVSPVYIHFEH